MQNHLPVVGLALGDPSGIGPEVCARLLASDAWRQRVRLLVIGDPRVLAQGACDAGVRLSWHACASAATVDWAALEAAHAGGEAPPVPLLAMDNADPAAFPRGAPSAAAGRVTGEALALAAQLALRGEVAALSYAPLNKGALNLGGWRYPDDLHLFAALTGYAGPPGRIGELNVQPGQLAGEIGEPGQARGLWTSRVTSHVPLRDIAQHLTPEAIVDAIELIDRTLRRRGLARPRIAVAALNPHAGDGGLCGDEEGRLIAPAIERAQAAGIGAEGPFASDTIFLRALPARDAGASGDVGGARGYDAVVSMYHDQGQIATKLLGFNRGVTVLAGLPVVLTTPAHGTAHDIVGQGKADPGALEQAVLLAGRLAQPAA
jgi:4-hydroxythreonine-4-phosphate dehydrogenase